MTALDLDAIKAQLPRLHALDETMRDNLDSRHAEVHLAALRIGNLAAEVERLQGRLEQAWREGYFTGKRDYAGSFTSGMSMSTPNPYSRESSVASEGDSK